MPNSAQGSWMDCGPASSAKLVVPETDAVKETQYRDRKAVSFRTLARVGLALIALTIAGVYLAYVKLIHYERHALEHLPEATEIAGRVDVERIVLFEPVRRYLLPLIDEIPLGSNAPSTAQVPASGDRLARLRQTAGLNLGLDLREIGFGVTEKGQDWVLSLGGLFPQKDMIDAIERTLRAEGASHVVRTAQRLRFDPWGAVLAQAQDGVLVLASRSEILEEALPSSRRFERLALLSDGPGSFAASAPWLRRVGASMFPADAAWVSEVERFLACIRIGADIRVEGQLELHPAASAESVRAGLRRWTTERLSTGSPAKVPTDWSEEWGLLARVQSSGARGDVIHFTTSWQRAELGRAVRDLANWLERRISVHQSIGP
jgi:hypothetical protein